jgi:hypothetical protein
MWAKYLRYRVSLLTTIFFAILWIISYYEKQCEPCRRIVSTTDERIDTYEIPNLVHFIIGQGDASEVNLDRFGPRLQYRRMERAQSEFQLINYLVLLSARRHLQPRQLFVHYSQEPTGYWWLKAKHDRGLNITVHRIPMITSIYQHTLYHHAHRTDIARLNILDQYGGIYLDFDVLVLRSFARLLNNNQQVEAIVAWESSVYQSICNAVILAPKSSIFLRRFIQSYQSFNGTCWACHSVVLLGQLAQIYSNEVLILPSHAFFTPSWTHIDELYIYNQYDFQHNYACHLWNSYVGKLYLSNLTLPSILNPSRMTTFVRMLRHAVGEEKLRNIAVS